MVDPEALLPARPSETEIQLAVFTAYSFPAYGSSLYNLAPDPRVVCMVAPPVYQLYFGVSSHNSGLRPERRMYDQATRAALIVVWEASDRICGKRLRLLMPILVGAMKRPGHLQLASEVRTGLRVSWA